MAKADAEDRAVEKQRLKDKKRMLKNKFKKVAAIFDLVLSLIESIELRKNLLKEMVDL